MRIYNLWNGLGSFKGIKEAFNVRTKRCESESENEKAHKPISMSNENLLRTHLFRHL